MNDHYKFLIKTPRRRQLFLLVALTMLQLNCREDRTTVVFGKVVDQDQQPMDSIMVSASGSHYLSIERLTATFTDKQGDYKLILDVPKRYHGLTITIPYLSFENPKFDQKYTIEKIFRNGTREGDCCPSTIGQTTEWNFEIKTK